MSTSGVLCFTPVASEAEQIRELLVKNGLPNAFTHASTPERYLQALAEDGVALVLAREMSGGFTALEALRAARARVPHVAFICLEPEAEARSMPAALFSAGVDDYVSPGSSWRLIAAIRRSLRAASLLAEQRRCKRRDRAMTRLLAAVQELSLARDLSTVQCIVRRAARDLTGAHGATFVLRDGDQCYYADEDAIAPLWKGQRFPLHQCVSGWVMTHRQPVVIEDIFLDSRVPADAYRPTFVKSLLMVPIRTEAPIGAIGNYWAENHRADADQIELLQALANTTSVALENVRVYTELEQRVKERTRQLEETNRELEAFSYSVSHDLRSPLSAILGYSDLLRESLAHAGTAEQTEACERIMAQAHRMSGLIRDLLRLARISATELKPERVNLSQLAHEILQRLKESEPHRRVVTLVDENLSATADRDLITIVVENLISNAWKYTGKVPEAQIEIGADRGSDGAPEFFVRDNGAGFNPSQANRLFAPFQRLHHQSDFPGTGVGLATVQRIVHRHGGRVTAKGAVGQGAVFSFSLAAQPPGRTDNGAAGEPACAAPVPHVSTIA